jgi:hypothetical protein
LRWNICKFILNVKPNFVSYCNDYHFYFILFYFIYELRWLKSASQVHHHLVPYHPLSFCPHHPNYEDLRITFMLQKSLLVLNKGITTNATWQVVRHVKCRATLGEKNNCFLCSLSISNSFPFLFLEFFNSVKSNFFLIFGEFFFSQFIYIYKTPTSH